MAANVGFSNSYGYSQRKKNCSCLWNMNHPTFYTSATSVMLSRRSTSSFTVTNQ